MLYVVCYLRDLARQLALYAVLLALLLCVSVELTMQKVLCVSVELTMEKVLFGCLLGLFSQESIRDYQIERVTEKIDFERKVIHQHYRPLTSIFRKQLFF